MVKTANYRFLLITDPGISTTLVYSHEYLVLCTFCAAHQVGTTSHLTILLAHKILDQVYVGYFRVCSLITNYSHL